VRGWGRKYKKGSVFPPRTTFSSSFPSPPQSQVQRQLLEYQSRQDIQICRATPPIPLPLKLRTALSQVLWLLRETHLHHHSTLNLHIQAPSRTRLPCHQVCWRIKTPTSPMSSKSGWPKKTPECEDSRRRLGNWDSICLRNGVDDTEH